LEAAIGQEGLGLELIMGDKSPEKTLAAAYSLEAGLRNFCLSMISRIKNVIAVNGDGYGKT